MNFYSLSYNLTITILVGLVAISILDERVPQFLYIQYKILEIDIRKKILLWKMERQWKKQDTIMRDLLEQIRKDNENSDD